MFEVLIDLDVLFKRVVTRKFHDDLVRTLGQMELQSRSQYPRAAGFIVDIDRRTRRFRIIVTGSVGPFFSFGFGCLGSFGSFTRCLGRYWLRRGNGTD